MKSEHMALVNALIHNGEAELFRLIAAGADINAHDKAGAPFVSSAVTLTAPPEHAPDPRPWLELIGKLIDLGADPTLLDDEGMSILVGPIFSQSTEMLELLLSRGVDPNHGCSEPWETIYDLAEFDYRHDVYLWAPVELGEPERRPQEDEDAWIDRLDRNALERGLQRPNLLSLLRRYGALSRRETALKLGGDGSESILWSDGRWRIRSDTASAS